MKKDKDKQADTSTIRRQAEKQLKSKEPEKKIPPSETDQGRFLHELQVHQIELGMQNEELRLARNEMEKMLNEFSDLYDFAPVGYFTVDRKGVISKANLTAGAFVGIERSRLIRRSFSLRVRNDMRLAFDAFLLKAFQSNTQESHETVLLKEGGQSRWIHIEAKAFNSGDQCRLAVVDITDRKIADDALRESEERYRTAIENAIDGITLVKGEKHIYVNTRFVEMFGYEDPSEIIGKPLSLTVHPDDLEMVSGINRMRQAGELAPSRYEFKGIGKDGKTISIEVSAAKTNYRGEPVSLVYLRDITDYKNLKEEFHQSQKMEALGTLAGGIAHDFNNILAGIIGFTEIALENVTSENPLHLYLARVLKAGHRGRDLVRQILSFCRLARQEKKAIAMSHVIEEALKLLRPALPSTIEIQARHRAIDDTILADPGQLHQVIINLCTNAAYAMRDTGGILGVTLANVDCSEDDAKRNPHLNPGAYMLLSVSDTGCGMTKDVMDRIFNPFFTTKPPGEGTGLGLSVIHGIVKSHIGYVTVSSELGKGSTFNVYIPRADAKAVSASLAESFRPNQKGHACILFVDDEELLVELNSQRLSRLGYTVVATTNSLDALNIFQKEPDRFDLVITDYTMPQMTGIELARKLLEIRYDIPIILSSGLSEQIEPAMIKQEGVKAFIAKTAGKDEIAELIRQVLSIPSA